MYKAPLPDASPGPGASTSGSPAGTQSVEAYNRSFQPEDVLFPQASPSFPALDHVKSSSGGQSAEAYNSSYQQHGSGQSLKDAGSVANAWSHL